VNNVVEEQDWWFVEQVLLSLSIYDALFSDPVNKKKRTTKLNINQIEFYLFEIIAIDYCDYLLIAFDKNLFRVKEIISDDIGDGVSRDDE